MKAIIVGTHGTGKTSLLEALKKEECFKDVDFISSPTRVLREKGFPINKDEKDYSATQMLCACHDIDTLLLHKNFIADRGILDTLIYTHYLYKKEKVSYGVDDVIQRMCMNFIDNYSHFFYIAPEFPMVGDGVRETDIQFQKDIQTSFEEMFDDWVAFYGISGRFEKVYKITGTVEERVNQIKRYLCHNRKF